MNRRQQPPTTTTRRYPFPHSKPLILLWVVVALGFFLPSQRVSAQSNVDLETCTPVGKDSQFNIELINMGGTEPNPRYVEAFVKAAERWSKVIVNDLQPDFGAGLVDDWFGGAFGSSTYNGPVDDLVIGYRIGTIDGPGGVLGAAGPVFVRRDRSNNPVGTISGVMEFDAADFDRMADTDIKLVILHEMGHVFGLIGTTTNRCSQSCNPTTQSRFINSPYTCPLARDEYIALFPTVTSSSLVLENDGGQGTACGHWEEDSFRTLESSELMTGLFEANLFQPLSLVTVAALDDLGGYQVDYCGADIWPATETTQKRFEIFRSNQTMNMDDDGGNSDSDGRMRPIRPIMGMDPDGRVNPIGDDAPTFTSGATQTVGSFFLCDGAFRAMSLLSLLSTMVLLVFM